METIVRIPAPLRTLTQGKDEVPATGSTVAEVIEDLEKRHPGIRDRLLDEKGVRRFVNVYVGDEDIRFLDGLKTALKAGDSIAVHGSFTSPRFAPVRISMDTGGWYRPDDNYVTPSNDGTYRFFIESPKSVLVAGRHKMKLSVKLDQRSSIWVEIGEVDFVVKLR